MGGAIINPKFCKKITHDLSFNIPQLKVEMDTYHIWYISNQSPQKKSGYTSATFVESAFATSPETVLELI